MVAISVSYRSVVSSNMKFLGLLLAIMAIVFAVVSGMSTGVAPAALQETRKAGCQGGPPGGGRGPPPPPPTNSTS